MSHVRADSIRRRIVSAALVTATFSMPASAQDTAPENPAELKDFRLDTPPPKEKAAESPPVPQPQAEDRTQPLPKAETPERDRGPQRAIKQTARQAAQETVTESEPVTKADDPVESPLSKALPESLPEAGTATTAATAGSEPDDSNPSDTAHWTSGLLRFWPALAALLVLLAGWLGFRWLRRQQHAATQEFLEAAPTPPIPPAENAIVPKTDRKKPAKAVGVLTASFEPSDARLSLANLTVTGCLRVHYEGAKPLNSLRLRNQVISACEEQQAMIDAFHADREAGQIDMLEAVQPGEDIVLTLELQVPRNGLQAFDWRERRFIAPILMLNLGSDDDRIEPCRINCLVGQEGDPASPRMHPLPIDRGPRHFAALQFRPLTP